MTKKENDSPIKKWIYKRKWDILFGIFIGLILFVPSIRIPVISTIQRFLAMSPSELSEEKQIKLSTYDWELVDLNGNLINFSESQGEIALVNFWATWCPPCVAEMPSLQELYDKHGDKIQMYLISNEKPEIIQRFLDKYGYTFPVYLPASNYPKEFESSNLPTTYVINKEGVIIMEEVGAHNWASKRFIERMGLK
ncbi:MAG: TlpA disulfide reductase family protein [Brumimicrobium sp.]